MNNKPMTKTIAALILLVGAVSAGATLAWLNPVAGLGGSGGTQTLPIDGGTGGSYFAYGNGSAEKPYGIKTQRHLYNLAWLQYIGYFDHTDATANDYGQQTYFELASDIDMDGWYLPPIGTEDHPFIGNFEGNGYVVSNLTVSNDFSDYNTHPSIVTGFDSTTYKQPHILGMFGVVGNYKNKYDTTKQNCVYSTSTNEFKNTGLTGVVIKTVLHDSLMGLAVGYVNANVSHVAVDVGTLNIFDDSTGSGNDVHNNATTSYGNFTTNISDHTVIGFTSNKKQLKRVSDTIYDVNVQAKQEFNAVTQGTGAQGWGGSINMLTLYERVKLAQTNSTRGSYVTMTTTTYAANGSVSSGPTNTSNYLYRYPNSNTITGVGNYVFSEQSSSINYLAGGSLDVKKYYSYYQHSGYYVTDGTNYLTWSGAALGNTTTQSSATVWTITQSSNVCTISTQYNGNTVYLCINNSNQLSTTTYSNATCNWTYTVDSQDSTKMSLSNSGYKLVYNNGWTLAEGPYYLVSQTIDTSTNYISSSSTSGNIPSNATSTTNAAHFYIDSNGVYFLSGTTRMYLTLYRRNNGNLQLRIYNTSTQNRAYYYKYDNGVLSTTYDGTTYYVVYNNGWTYTNSNDNTCTVTLNGNTSSNLSNTFSGDQVTKNGPDSYLDNKRQVDTMSYTATNTSYFPLNVTKDGGTDATSLTNGNYLPTSSNTGYIISGSMINNSTGAADSVIRISQYAMSSINNSYTSGSSSIDDKKVYTHNASNQQVTISADGVSKYEKYSSSKTAFYNNALKGNSYVYGLHFLNSQISLNRLVTASNISILGTSHSTYQLPVDSVDFNLKDKGFINFFAGTYYNGSTYGRNNSFFSLHMVLRNGSGQITSIKEIEEIYGNNNKSNYSFAYKFTDGTYSKPYRIGPNKTKYEMSANDAGTVEYVPAYDLNSTAFQTYTNSYGYVSLFNTSRIKNIDSNGDVITALTYNALYYFEIPMNSGEYCLGSVDGGVGGYLIYLDIGASATKIQRTMVAEHFLSDVTTYNYPVGAAIVSIDSIKGDNPTFDEKNGICTTVKPTYKGEIVIERVNNVVSITRNSAYAQVAKPSYISDTIQSVVDPGSGSSLKFDCFNVSKTSTETYRVTYYDINASDTSLTIWMFTDTRSTNANGVWGNFTRSIKVKSGDSDFVNYTSGSTLTVYRYLGASNANTGVAWSYTDLTNLSSTLFYDTAARTVNAACSALTTSILELYTYLMNLDVNVSSTITLEMVQDSSIGTGTYYKYGDYVIIPTVSGNNTVTYVVKTIDGKTVYMFTSGTGGVALTEVDQTQTAPQQ